MYGTRTVAFSSIRFDAALLNSIPIPGSALPSIFQEFKQML